MKEVIQSALYLSGNKRELFNDIAPHLEVAGRRALIEPFAGTATVALNCEDRLMFGEYYLNDIQTEMVKLHQSLTDVDWIIKTYEENKKYEDSREAFDQLKKDFNSNIKRMDLLYLIMMRSHSNSIRFNKKGECNITHGKRERFDIERMLKHHHLSKDFFWYNLSFANFMRKMLKRFDDMEGMVVYIDPPYTTTTTHYTDAWTVQQDEILLSLMDTMRMRGAKIVYSNVFHNRGKTNQWLIDWCEAHKEDYDVYYMDRDYSNCSSFKSTDPTVEVLIVSKEK